MPRVPGPLPIMPPPGWAGMPRVARMFHSPSLPGIPFPAILTAEARRYGFHGTLRAPFRLAEGISEDQASARVAALAARLAPVTCDGLVIENLQGFLALTPMGCEAALLELAAAVVEGTNDLRAPLTEAEIARRRPGHPDPAPAESAGHLGLSLRDGRVPLSPDADRPAARPRTGHGGAWRRISRRCCPDPS